MLLQMNRSWHSKLTWLYCNGRLHIYVLILTALVLASCRHQPVRSACQPFTFVQMCDPQIGFTDYAGDLACFQQAINQINALHPDLVVICGDLVNAPNKNSFDDFNAAKARLTMPSRVAAGNHDVGNKPDLQSLKRYRRFVGKDFYSFNHKGYTFVFLNSQLWKAPVPQETEKQDAWLVRTLEAAAKKQRPVFIVMHYPPFVKDADEPDEYFNLPREKRRELLSLLNVAASWPCWQDIPIQ